MPYAPDVLIERVFDSVTDDAAMAELSVYLATAAGCPSAQLMVHGEDTVRQETVHGMTADVLALYAAHYWRTDVWAIGYRKSGLNTVEVSDRFVSDDMMLRSETYNDLCRHHGDLFRCMGFVSDIGGGERLLLGLHRTRTQPQFEPALLAGMQAVQPLLLHLIKARRRAAAGRGRITERLLDAEPDAVAVVGPTGRLIYANAAAHSTFAGSGPLCLSADRLSARDPGFARTLARAIAWACSGRGGQALSLRWPAGEGGRSYRVAVDRLEGSSAGLACVRLRDEEARFRAGVDAAAQAWSLSPAERALAEAMLQGLSPAEHADRRGVRLSTVRTQVRQLFAKAGVARNGELVAALWSTAVR